MNVINILNENNSSIINKAIENVNKGNDKSTKRYISEYLRLVNLGQKGRPSDINVGRYASIPKNVIKDDNRRKIKERKIKKIYNEYNSLVKTLKNIPDDNVALKKAVTSLVEKFKKLQPKAEENLKSIKKYYEWLNSGSQSKNQENFIKNKYEEKSSRPKKEKKLKVSRNESGFTFGKHGSGSKIDFMVNSALNPSLNYYSELLRDIDKKGVNFLKMDSKILSKKRNISKNLSIEQVGIEVKHVSKTSKFVLADILSLKTKNDFENFKNKLLNKLNKKIPDKDIDSFVKRYYMKVYNSTLSSPTSIKNQLINKIYTHFSSKDTASFLSMGMEGNEATAPLTRKYVNITIEPTNEKKVGNIALPRLVVKVKFTKEGLNYKGPVTEELYNFTKELLND